MILMLLLACAAVPAQLQCADSRPSQAGKADAAAAFAKQAPQAGPATGPAPHLVGTYVWSGRADENYKPFFQWEVRMIGGTAAASGLNVRVVTLGPDRKPLVTGPWKPLGSLASGASRDFDYKLNCTNPPAYQIEMTWKEGKETYLCWDKVSVPVALSDQAMTSFLVTINQNAEYSDSARTALVTWTLWNIGGQPGHEVVQTVRFLDDKGKEVAKADFKPENGEVAAGLVKDEKFTAKKIPPFSIISIGTKATDAGTLATLDPGAFTGAKDVEVAKIRVDGKQLKARVRNGTGAALMSVVVSITLQTRDGKAVRHFDLPVGKLAADEERDVVADLTGVGVWSSYEVGWHNDGAGTSAP
jgi:hypothetical protein